MQPTTNIRQPGLHRHWLWRLAGVSVLLICVVLYEPNDSSGWHRIVLPLVMGIAAALVVQSTLAAAGAGALLAGIHSNWGNLAQGFWIDSIAFPAITLVCTLITLAILVQRFRQQIAATREVRHHARGNRTANSADPERP